MALFVHLNLTCMQVDIHSDMSGFHQRSPAECSPHIHPCQTWSHYMWHTSEPPSWGSSTHTVLRNSYRSDRSACVSMLIYTPANTCGIMVQAGAIIYYFYITIYLLFNNTVLYKIQDVFNANVSVYFTSLFLFESILNIIVRKKHIPLLCIYSHILIQRHLRVVYTCGMACQDVLHLSENGIEKIIMNCLS